MPIYAGIDEAGYGPLMGPLCVGCSAWEISDETAFLAPPDLWGLLKSAICRRARDRRGRVAIEDSKKLKGSGAGGVHPMAEIERGVLALLGVHDAETDIPATDAALLEALGAESLESRAPWYCGARALPLACDPGRLAVGRAMVSRACRNAKISRHRLRCLTADADEINDVARVGAAKSSVTWGLVVRHIHALRQAHPGQAIRVAIDRQGGRRRYHEDLMREFPGDRLTILMEEENESAYRLDGPQGALLVSFTVEGERHHLPIALASMAAKYSRELWMARLNTWFAQRVEGVRPTAGYVLDGRRFLAAVRPTLAAQAIPERLLVRSI